MSKHDMREGCCRPQPNLVEDLRKALNKVMIAQTTLDASVKGLTAAVDAAVAALATASTATSTPDASVSAYQAAVDAQTVRLATATPPPPATPTVAAAKA
jgi:hypothetical protein